MRFLSIANKMLPAVPLLIVGLALVGCASTPPPAEPAAEETAPPNDETAPTTEELEARELELEQREAALAQREAQPPPRTSVPAPSRPATAPAGSAPAVGSSPATTTPYTPPVEAAPAYRTVVYTLPTATNLEVEFLDGLSSETNQVGDTFRTSVTRDVLQDGRVVIPAGSSVLGSVTAVTPAKKIGGQASIELRFDRIELLSGETMPVQATLTEVGKSQAGKDTGTIGGSAVGGAVLGRLLSKKDKGKGTVVGAAVGAAVGTAIAAGNKNDPVEIPEGTISNLSLDTSLDVALRVAQ